MSFSLHAGMPETTSAAIRVVKGLDREPLYRLVPGDDQLSYALAVVDNKRLIRQVNQNHAYFTTVVGVYCPRRVQQTDAVLQSEAPVRLGHQDWPAGPCRRSAVWHKRATHGGNG